ncbi:purine-nucleoside phosphorylase [Rubrivivax gelatinosus]|uniref:Purine nucleoside phosphorylase n=1 Tax=Rubrivivax gelatinosus TaxID=28068 RepID=A0A4R2M8S7_RUBGE|nr:purine-nucleoside phosphorylase [Rubrivivax gelatinosus]MBK1686628.1 purine-nucleoside phosphorylase [Rubrivivax gelatinosus]TCP00837.1 purine-nucleoside phosphorylase [Rubrivivax gelatinosus]
MNESIAASVQRLAALGPAPAVAVVLGSGWDGIAALVDDPVDVPYAELPAFPRLSVAGHAGVLRAGRVGGTPVWLLRGRKHAYEDGDAAGMKGAIRTLAAAGCRTLVLSNAAGSLDAAMPPGSLMLIADHLNVVQRTPLHGEPGNDRFVDMGRAYDPALRELARQVAAGQGITLPEGVYAWVLGPQFETPAEIRMLAAMGAQAVGMSTVPETILARHAGLRVLGLSMFTNMAAGLSAETLSHEHTMAVARGGAADAARLLAALLPVLAAA